MENPKADVITIRSQADLPSEPNHYPITISVPLELLTVIAKRGQQTKETMYEYGRLMAEGVEFPPGDAIYDGSTVWLWDGAIRKLACATRGRDHMLVRVVLGSEHDAHRSAYRANAENPLHRSPADKRCVIHLALNREGGAKLSARELGRLCLVSHTFAGKIRNEYLATNPQAEPEIVSVRRNGIEYEMKTSGIGRKNAPHSESCLVVLSDHPTQQDPTEPCATSETSTPAKATTTELLGTPEPDAFDSWKERVKALLKETSDLHNSAAAIQWLRRKCEEMYVEPIPAEVLVWRGPSEIDGSMIRVVASSLGTTSNNSKTGDMVQVAIIVDAMPFWEACKQGRDKAVCGDCKHRRNHLSTCYVYGGEAINPHGMWDRTNDAKADLDGALDAIRRANKPVRIGMYGDPSAVPFEIISSLVKASQDEEGQLRYTAYTHRWKDCDQRLKELALASVDTEDELATAQGHGWQTFRVVPTSGSPLPAESHCRNAASKELGVRVQCHDCLGCQPAQGSKWIEVHNIDPKIKCFNAFSRLQDFLRAGGVLADWPEEASSPADGRAYHFVVGADASPDGTLDACPPTMTDQF